MPDPIRRSTLLWVIAVLLPALTGQAGRVLLFSKKGNFSKTYCFSTIFLEVVLD